MFGLVWFGLVLWYINHYRLFNAKLFLYIYLETSFLNELELIFCTQLKKSYLFTHN